VDWAGAVEFHIEPESFRSMSYLHRPGYAPIFVCSGSDIIGGISYDEIDMLFEEPNVLGLKQGGFYQLS
jgi:hypothetical protein